ncbi:MAG: serine/threonine protein kinase [Dermatophilaceae bacterium]|nr:serine/threonine protein kinase [Dermatophilaceae bacterium]
MAFLWVRPKQVRDEEIRVFYIVAGQASEDEDEDADDEEYASDDAEDDTGAVLGERFELLEAIAWGGTAAVYRARDHVTKAEVAVKVLCSGVRAQLGRYFGQEGRLAAQLCNPHLVRAHHFGVDEGRPFIVFDLVPGRSLPALYFKQPMPWRELCEVVLGLLDALGTMHQQGIVHRDVKPDNVVVWRRPNHPDHVTLLDVGFAAVPPERKMTNAPEPTRMVFGTHGYIAPELFAGHLPDPRSDLYSVGALMYEMLTSLPVTDLSNAPEILAIAPPRVVAPGADIPEAVEDVVMQALSDIEARFQSATAMATAIREALAPLPVSVPIEVAVPVPVPVEVRLPAPHRRAWVIPAALSLGVLLGGGVFGLISTRTGSVPGPNVIAGSEREPELPRGSGLDEPGVREAPGATPGTTPMISEERPMGSDLRKPDAGDGVVALAAQATPTPTRSSLRRRGAVSTAPTKQGFAAAMIKLEPAARHCARENGVAEDPVQVEVRRGADGTVDAVRIWDMSVRHPFARCIDKLVRDAALPNKGAPVESFELFRDRAPR